MAKMTYQHMYERKSYYMIVTNWLDVNSVMIWRYRIMFVCYRGVWIKHLSGRCLHLILKKKNLLERKGKPN